MPLFEIGDPNIPLLLSIYGVTGLTALNAMKLIPEDHRPPKKTFCVSSAAGSTGSIALQIAKHMGYRTIGIVSGAEKRDFVLGLGADACITYNDSKIDGEIDVR